MMLSRARAPASILLRSTTLLSPLSTLPHPLRRFHLSRPLPVAPAAPRSSLSPSSSHLPSPSPSPSTVPDLSYHSEPLGALFPPFPRTHSALSPFLLSPTQLTFYRENGFISNLPALTPAQCDAILSHYQQFLLWDTPTPPTSPSASNPSTSLNDAHRLSHPGLHLFHEFHSNQTGDPNNVLSHMLGHWRISPLFHDLPFHPALTVASAQLAVAFFQPIPSSPSLNPTTPTPLVPLCFWHDQLFAKPPHFGGNVAWHQDYSYWTRTVPCNHITVHIALDDQTLENGSLHFIPGSHRWSRVAWNELSGEEERLPLPVTDFNFADMEGIQGVLTEEERRRFRPVPGLLKKGEMSIHHPFTVHGSYPNRSDKPRRAAVVNYFVGR